MPERTIPNLQRAVERHRRAGTLHHAPTFAGLAPSSLRYGTARPAATSPTTAVVDLPHACPERVAEFLAGRAAAQAAIAQLDRPRTAETTLPIGPNRAPRWPADVAGSITHCAGLALAVASLRNALTAVGVDAEPDEPRPPGLAPLLLTPREQSRYPRLTTSRLAFSAKEAFYKCWSSAGGEFLEFLDVDLWLGPHPHQFSISAPDGNRWPGAYTIHHQRILTLCWPPPPSQNRDTQNLRQQTGPPKENT
jgi:4'-phosphopantetheinyl transferase EntD